MSFFDSRLDVNGADVRAMTRHLVEKGVAITSTLAVGEDFTGGARQPLSWMTNREERALGWTSWLMYRMIRNQFQKHPFTHLLTKEMQFERDFAASGGLLLAGCDPTGDGTLAGYGDQRESELLVQAGFAPEQAIHISTANGAKFLGQESRIGTIAVGK